MHNEKYLLLILFLQNFMAENIHPINDIIHRHGWRCQVNFKKIQDLMAFNVPAVYDVFAARIRALRSKDQGRQTVPEQRRGNEAKRNDLAVVEAEPPTGGEA
jgi:hypothetical protein